MENGIIIGSGNGLVPIGHYVIIPFKSLKQHSVEIESKYKQNI